MRAVCVINVCIMSMYYGGRFTEAAAHFEEMVAEADARPPEPSLEPSPEPSHMLLNQHREIVNLLPNSQRQRRTCYTTNRVTEPPPPPSRAYSCCVYALSGTANPAGGLRL